MRVARSDEIWHGEPDYGDAISGEDEFMFREEFIGACSVFAYVDDDGYGYPCMNGLMARTCIIQPSEVHTLPESTTHIMWFNR